MFESCLCTHVTRGCKRERENRERQRARERKPVTEASERRTTEQGIPNRAALRRNGRIPIVGLRIISKELKANRVNHWCRGTIILTFCCVVVCVEATPTREREFGYLDVRIDIFGIEGGIALCTDAEHVATRFSSRKHRFTVHDRWSCQCLRCYYCWSFWSRCLLPVRC